MDGTLHNTDLHVLAIFLTAFITLNALGVSKPLVGSSGMDNNTFMQQQSAATQAMGMCTSVIRFSTLTSAVMMYVLAVLLVSFRRQQHEWHINSMTNSITQLTSLVIWHKFSLGNYTTAIAAMSKSSAAPTIINNNNNNDNSNNNGGGAWQYSQLSLVMVT
jgi:hypothetical protein